MLLRLRRSAEVIGQIAWGMARGVIPAGRRPTVPTATGAAVTLVGIVAGLTKGIYWPLVFLPLVASVIAR